MIKYFLLGAVGLCAVGCQSVNIQGEAIIGYERYKDEKGHKAFFIFQDNEGGYAWAYAHGRATRQEAYKSAQRSCEQTGAKYAFKGCEPYFIDDINVSHMPKAKIAALLAEDDFENRTQVARSELEGRWENVADKIHGVVYYSNKSRKNRFRVYFDEVSCKGRWTYEKGAYGTATPPEGSWFLQCSDSRTASGTYHTDQEGSGKATGVDPDGNQLNITFWADPKIDS